MSSFILVFSAVEPDFNPGLLDRFLVLIEYHNIKPIICISKMDLVDEKMKATVEAYANDYREMGYDVLFTSINTSESIDILKPYLENCVSVGPIWCWEIFNA